MASSLCPVHVNLISGTWKKYVWNTGPLLIIIKTAPRVREWENILSLPKLILNRLAKYTLWSLEFVNSYTAHLFMRRRNHPQRQGVCSPLHWFHWVSAFKAVLEIFHQNYDREYQKMCFTYCLLFVPGWGIEQWTSAWWPRHISIMDNTNFEWLIQTLKQSITSLPMRDYKHAVYTNHLSNATELGHHNRNR